jgi:hypothetical protein
MKHWDELSELEQLACLFSDFYKDVHGVRPRFMDDTWTVADYQREIDGLRDYSEILEKEQKEFEERKIQEVEERIAKLIAIGAGDRATAIRWIRDAEDCNENDEDYLCFVLGIPYGYFKGVDNAI